MEPRARKKVILLGAGDGIGLALAKLYQENQWDVIPVTRTQGDLASPEETQALAIRLARDHKNADLFIITAGMAEAGYLDSTPTEAFRRSFEVNFFAPIRFLQAFHEANIPCDFVFFLSGVGEFLIPGMAPYALSKRSFRDYLYILGLENAFPSSRILTVWPGYVTTRFKNKTKVHGRFELPQGLFPRSPERVAQLVFEAQQKGKSQLVLSPLPNLLGYLQRVFPCLFRWLIRQHPTLRKRR